MQDPRIDTLARTLLDHSCRLQAGEKILIEAFDLPDPALVCALVELAAERGGLPVVSCKSNSVLRSLYRRATAESMALCGSIERSRMQQMDCYVGIRGAANSNGFADVPAEQMDLYQQHWWHTVHSEIRVPDTRWVVLRYPTASMAQSAKMSTEAFEDFFFDVCTADYARMAEDLKPLQARMEAADRVQIIAPGTDLSFSIKDIPVIPCSGGRNIPDGECFTAPVRDSVNGTITFNTQSLYQGTVFDAIQFTFADGKIAAAECGGETERLNAILDADEGARYIGEWSLGTNNRVRHPMLDTLFDEKIGGSFHLTPGQAYDEADNGNRSRIHWDLVLIQTPAYGGGEIHFDGELVRKDGRFLPEDLQPLNHGLDESVS
ncbi:MAG: aminopeptidase [Planctomycetaceae bacterium]|jgi:aminopeptidase|nr:aminopeptidase [Planctomycetaceae bacterium]